MASLETARRRSDGSVPSPTAARVKLVAESPPLESSDSNDFVARTPGPDVMREGGAEAGADAGGAASAVTWGRVSDERAPADDISTPAPSPMRDRGGLTRGASGELTRTRVFAALDRSVFEGRGGGATNSDGFSGVETVDRDDSEDDRPA